MAGEDGRLNDDFDAGLKAMWADGQKMAHRLIFLHAMSDASFDGAGP